MLVVVAETNLHFFLIYSRNSTKKFFSRLERFNSDRKYQWGESDQFGGEHHGLDLRRGFRII